jgi:DNA integrity scanning protein DisA with diadenylate cyclase activity
VILIDTAEPEELEQLLQQSVSTTRLSLNQTKRADYYFGGADGKSRQFCRVQINELLSDMDSQEQELVRYYYSADQTGLIIEGVCSPMAIQLGRASKDLGITVRMNQKVLGRLPAAIFTYPIAANGFCYDSHMYKVSKSILQAWRYRLEECGIIVIDTVNYIDTAITLVSIYNNCQKPESEHTTLTRYIRPKIRIEEHNPLVEAIMGVSHAYKLGIGEEKAKAIAKNYGSLIDIVETEASDLCKCEGIGKPTAEKILKALGRI